MLKKGQFKYDNIDDKAALLHHYHISHRLTLQTKPDIADCFFVTFIDQPPKHLSSIYKNIWLDKLNATINTNKMLLPSIKSFCNYFLFLEYCCSFVSSHISVCYLSLTALLL